MPATIDNLMTPPINFIGADVHWAYKSQHLRWMQLIHEFSKRFFNWRTQWTGTISLSLILRIQRLKIYVGVLMFLYQFWIWKFVAHILQLSWFNHWFRHAALLLLFLLKIWSGRIVDTIVCFGTLLFSPATDSAKHTLNFGFICQEQQQSCYACPSSTYPLCRIPAVFTNGNKA